MRSAIEHVKLKTSRLRRNAESPASRASREAVKELRTRLEALRRKLRSASPEMQRSAEYAKEEAEFYALKERVQTMVTRRIAARAAEPADHVVMVHLTKSQHAKLEKVAHYDGHRFIEETAFSAVRCHCIAFLAAVHHMPEWEAEARFDGGQRPTEATRHQ